MTRSVEEMCQYIRARVGRVSRQVGADAAEDVVQSACLAYVAAAASRHIEKPHAYAMAIIRHEVISAIRRRQNGRRHVSLESADGEQSDLLLHAPSRRLVDPGPNPEAAAASSEERRLMRAALVEMPRRKQEIVVRSILLDESPGQTCEILEITETQYRLHKSRAKQDLVGRARRKFRQLPRAA